MTIHLLIKIIDLVLFRNWITILPANYFYTYVIWDAVISALFSIAGWVFVCIYAYNIRGAVGFLIAGPAGERHASTVSISLDMKVAGRAIRAAGGGMRGAAAVLRQEMQDLRARHRAYVNEHGADMPEITDWLWIPSENQDSAES